MRVFVEGFGCSQNQGETSSLSDTIHHAGHALADGPEGADAAVLVTCGVIGSTESRMVRRWRSLCLASPRVVVTGCLVPLRTELFHGPGLEHTRFVAIRAQSGIPDLLDHWGPEVREGPEPAAVAASREVPPATAEIVLAQGCTSHCTYCFSRLARGRLTSRPIELLEREVDEAVARGRREIRLSSLDTSCWGADRSDGMGLPELLRRLGSRPGDHRFRLGMLSPQSLLPIAERLWPAMAATPTFRFLHLPVQSGSDRVLDAMRRGYEVETVRRLVTRARELLPDLMLATDVIVGFPGEGEAEFAETLGLIEELEPEIVNVTRFSARPLTPAALLPPLPSGTVKRRSRELTRRRMALARRRMERWIGRSGDAWIVEPGRDGSSIARLENYLPVVLPEPYAGADRVRVRIEGARSTHLLGRRSG